jgi:hypothetical protein
LCSRRLYPKRCEHYTKKGVFPAKLTGFFLYENGKKQGFSGLGGVGDWGIFEGNNKTDLRRFNDITTE